MGCSARIGTPLNTLRERRHVLDNIEITQPGIRYRETPLLLRSVGGKSLNFSAKAGAPFLTGMAARVRPPTTSTTMAWGEIVTGKG